MTSPISTPARYTPAFAVGFSDTGGDFSLVHAEQPLPVTMAASPPAAPLSGTTTTNLMAGPYIPVAGRTVMIALSGTWSGTVRLLRSIDGGATRVPVTVGGSAWGQFTGNACEPVWAEEEDGVSLWLDITLTSGNLSYRLSQ